MDSTCSAEKQASPHDQENPRNLKKLVISSTKKLKMEKEKEKEMEIENVKEGCKTPTSPENKIPSLLKCPPPPKKKPSPPLATASKRRTSFYQQQVTAEEIEEFFQALPIRK
ncbi:hypothetical protein HN873_026057 [Arachis hypogaea]|uniref:Cyclin-dependent protein kinase inhibitor n=1 Tax=Arachis hypogaea TaxID=3818 RepID=A0A445BWD8_ARAHY|nr:cyclin-dependent protein kinase inhibitor SMR4 [Arachis hypogaea]QHO30964.1 uncharacterized protein DS421_8g237510 [Arachis hypogaea]RYR42962.1 hypothetical protein Ahy_A08g039394 [Arachis hypogaea]